MRGALPAAVALAATLGVAGGCQRGDAPTCRDDAECDPGQRCLRGAGLCVGFDRPLLPAPDAGAPLDAGAPAADAAPADGAAADATPADAAATG